MVSKKTQKNIAKEHLEALFKEAKKISKSNHSLADRYVTLARKISAKSKVRIPKKYKKLFCKKCCKYLIPGKTLRARTKKGKLIYYCLNCKHITRYPFKKI